MGLENIQLKTTIPTESAVIITFSPWMLNQDIRTGHRAGVIMKFLAAQLANITPLAALTVALREIFKNSNYSLTGLLCIIYPQSELNLFAEIKQMFTCVAIF